MVREAVFVCVFVLIKYAEEEFAGLHLIHQSYRAVVLFMHLSQYLDDHELCERW